MFILQLPDTVHIKKLNLYWNPHYKVNNFFTLNLCFLSDCCMELQLCATATELMAAKSHPSASGRICKDFFFFLIKVYKGFLWSSERSVNSRLSVLTVPNLEFSLRPPFSGSQVVLKKGCSAARGPGISATALCLLQILNSSSFGDFERISVKIPSSRCCVSMVLLSSFPLILEIQQKKEDHICLCSLEVGFFSFSFSVLLHFFTF